MKTPELKTTGLRMATQSRVMVVRATGHRREMATKTTSTTWCKLAMQVATEVAVCRPMLLWGCRTGQLLLRLTPRVKEKDTGWAPRPRLNRCRARPRLKRCRARAMDRRPDDLVVEEDPSLKVRSVAFCPQLPGRK
jgi:hypothetical protein